MAALIDSSVLIAAERGELDLESLLAERGQVDAALAAITVAELLHGVQRLRASARRIRVETWSEEILAALPVIAFDMSCARAHAHLGALLAKKGTGIGAHGLIIAATALAKGYSVLTKDRRSFSKVPELDVMLV